MTTETNPHDIIIATEEFKDIIEEETASDITVESNRHSVVS